MNANPALQFAPTVPGRIHRAGFGWTNIGGIVYEHDRVIHRGGVSPVWWRRRRHYFELVDAEELVRAYQPDALILGTGWMGMMRVDVEGLTSGLNKWGVAFDALRTPEAVARYQNMFQQGIDVVVALHVTC